MRLLQAIGWEPRQTYAFRGKHVVVTGSASGIGLELCKLLLARNVAGLYMIDWNPTALATTTQQLRATPTTAKISALEADVSEFSQVCSFSG